jgi:hypothetical protein
MRVVDGQKLLMAHRETMQDQDDRPCDGVPIIEEVPDFRSQIPPEILSKLSKEQQALFALVSKIEQSQSWGNQNDVVHNRAIHKLCQSTDAINRKISLWTIRYGVLSWVAGVVASAILIKIVNIVFESFSR